MMAEISWPDFAEKVKENAAVFVPLGATEQHGPHMGLGVDVVLPSAVCARVAKNVGGIVAPAIPYGYTSQPRSGGGETFPGTISLDMNTLTLVVRDVICGLAKHGIRRVVVACGHFENLWPAIEGISLALRELRRDGISDLTVLRIDYWDFVHRHTLERLFPQGFPGTELEHASLLETSMMLEVRPDMVKMDKVPHDGPATFPRYDRYPVASGTIPQSGVLARAAGATAEKGQWLLDDHVELVTEAVIEGFGLEVIPPI